MRKFEAKAKNVSIVEGISFEIHPFKQCTREQFEQFQSLQDYESLTGSGFDLICSDFTNLKLKNGKGNYVDHKRIEINIVECSRSSGCERNETKIKDFMKSALVAVFKIDKKIDFERYDGKPTRYELSELMYESLNEESKIFVQADLQ